MIQKPDHEDEDGQRQHQYLRSGVGIIERHGWDLVI